MSRSRRKFCAASLAASANGVADGVISLQRELGVDHQRGLAVRHPHETIRPGAVRKGGLELISSHGQAIGNDRFHARLAEGATGLLVGKDRLEPDHVLGERLDIVLRGIDHRKTFLQTAQVLMRRLGLLGHRCAQPMRHAVEPVADRLVEFGLPRAEDLGHGGHAPLHFRLRAHDFGKPGFSRLCLGGKRRAQLFRRAAVSPATIMTASRMKSTSPHRRPAGARGLTETPETVKTGMKRAEVSVCMGGH